MSKECSKGKSVIEITRQEKRERKEPQEKTGTKVMSNNVLINMRYGPSVRPNDRISAELSFCFFLWTSTSSRSMKTPKKKKKK